MATIEERIRALENSENQELVDILLDLTRVLEYEFGLKLKPLKRKIKNLERKSLQAGQQRINMPK